MNTPIGSKACFTPCGSHQPHRSPAEIRSRASCRRPGSGWHVRASAAAARTSRGRRGAPQRSAPCHSMSCRPGNLTGRVVAGTDSRPRTFAESQVGCAQRKEIPGLIAQAQPPRVAASGAREAPPSCRSRAHPPRPRRPGRTCSRPFCTPGIEGRGRATPGIELLERPMLIPGRSTESWGTIHGSHFGRHLSRSPPNMPRTRRSPRHIITGDVLATWPPNSAHSTRPLRRSRPKTMVRTVQDVCSAQVRTTPLPS